MGLMEGAKAGPGTENMVEGDDGQICPAKLAEIPRGKRVDIPVRTT